MTSKIYGKVSVCETGEGIANLRIKAIDKDILFDDLLGSAITDKRGCFLIEYDARDFQEFIFDRIPDIYVEVINQDSELIHTTELRARYGASTREEFDIRIPARLLQKRSGIQSFTIKPEGGLIDHPDGFSIQVPSGAFTAVCAIEVSSLDRALRSPDSLGALGSGFIVRSNVESSMPVRLSLAVSDGDLVQIPHSESGFFFELEEATVTKIVPATIRKPGDADNGHYVIEAMADVLKTNDISISAGVFAEAPTSTVFHPVPHYFKISELGGDEAGGCRREASENCTSPSPQALYPACLPAGMARLFGAYRLVLSADQRRWHVGTPTNPHPDPDEDGDHFSPPAMGVHYGVDYERAVRVEDWRADVPVEIWKRNFELGNMAFSLESSQGEHLHAGPVVECLSDAFRDAGHALGSDVTLSVLDWCWEIADPENARYFLIQPYRNRYLVRLLDSSVEDAIVERARNIQGALIWLVSGPRIAGTQSIQRPVYIEHAGHGWNIVGVEGGGYWSHGENQNTAALSGWCRWENAPWLGSSGERYRPVFTIKYPRSCGLKPEGKRLGSISMWGSGGNRNHVQFDDLPSGKTIDWTPHMKGSAAKTGYLWIEDGCRLNSDGLPISIYPGGWDDQLGVRIPVPENDFGRCSCAGETGCPRCRTRLNLPFWVHNTTLDALHTYKVDAYFWTVDERWVSQDAHFIEPEGTTYLCFPDVYSGDTYKKSENSLPGPAPGEAFRIQAVPDTSPEPSKTSHPFNWQPIAWCIDLHRDQFSPYERFHGIKLVLTCTDNCLVQDIRQLWFKSQHWPVW